jgi:hypothetical protein
LSIRQLEFVAIVVEKANLAEHAIRPVRSDNYSYFGKAVLFLAHWIPFVPSQDDVIATLLLEQVLCKERTHALPQTVV